MLDRIAKTLMAAIFTLCGLYSFAQCNDKVRDFYVAYMQNMEKNEGANAELMKEHMSPELIAQLAEYTQQYGADAVVHAQDVCEHCIQSLIVLNMGKEDWYLVKYKWSPESEYTFFPVQAIDIDGQFIILDISPLGTDADGNSYIKRK